MVSSCFDTFFRLPLGLGALPAMRLLMEPMTSDGQVEFGSFPGHTPMLSSPHKPFKKLPGPSGHSPAETDPHVSQPGLHHSQTLTAVVMPAPAMELTSPYSSLSLVAVLIFS